jgi:hypothetical protein
MNIYYSGTTAFNGINTTASGVYFIPPKYSKPPAPVVVEGGDYSSTEQPVMVNDGGTLRQKTDTDNKPVYTKTVNINISGTTTGGVQTRLDIDNIDTLLNLSGYVTYNQAYYNGYETNKIPIDSMILYDARIKFWVNLNYSKGLYVDTRAMNADWTVTGKVTAEYTRQ